ncbi:m-AAA protease-interacting protein 1, mitochondrial [Sitophilus oryzae]|uniref:M-AAA protease-interacting protein 1, mitochondrial n=1 Tax=Sitophilus oryzae TaxID=7048 RepID=A0A6J2XQU4_SITOR|nr:m-AAA protease-interacting protein 1, mitochondrial [Sitophilus oryzae]
MNINLIKVVQNLKNCNKFINKYVSYNKLCNLKCIRHSSSLTSLTTCRKSIKNGNIPNLSTERCYCENKSPENKLPPLMNISHIVWPSIFKSFRNLLLTTFIIKPYFDPEFKINDFVNGSKKAVEVVSHKLVESSLEDLNGLVTEDIIPDLQKALSLMSVSQRELLAIKMEDIYFAFPYQIGVIFNDDKGSENQKRFVEITMVYHTLKGLAAMKSSGEEPPLNAGSLPEYQGRISISNYRFIKEFTKGVDSDWTVNLLNHFRPIDDINNL